MGGLPRLPPPPAASPFSLVAHQKVKTQKQNEQKGQPYAFSLYRQWARMGLVVLWGTAAALEWQSSAPVQVPHQ